MSGTPVWERGGWQSLPPLHGDVRADVCVVGLGGAGLACVHELLDLGLDVTAIDAGAVAGGAAGRNAGFLLAGMYHFHHDAVRRHGRSRAVEIYHLTLAQIARMAHETPQAVRRTGSLRIAESRDEELDCAAQLVAMRADDLPVEPYAGPEGRGLLLPQDAAFDPLLRARTLARRALERGARLYECSAATGIETGLVQTPGGGVRCAAVVIAVDGALPRVLPELASRVRTARLQMLATAPTREVIVPRPVYANYGYEYWQQLPDGRIALGGFRDRGGTAEWTDSTEPTAFIQRLLELHLRGRLGVAAPIQHRWGASISYTDTGMSICEEIRPQVWALGGYCGTGNVMGPLCGRGAARALACADRTLIAPFLSGPEDGATPSAPSAPRAASSPAPTARSHT